MKKRKELANDRGDAQTEEGGGGGDLESGQGPKHDPTPELH